MRLSEIIRRSMAPRADSGSRIPTLREVLGSREVRRQASEPGIRGGSTLHVTQVLFVKPDPEGRA